MAAEEKMDFTSQGQILLQRLFVKSEILKLAAGIASESNLIYRIYFNPDSDFSGIHVSSIIITWQEGLDV